MNECFYTPVKSGTNMEMEFQARGPPPWPAGLAPPPHGKCAGRRVRWWCHIDRAASVDTHDSALAAVLGLDDERRRAASSQETRARVDEPGAREPANKALALPEPLDPAR